jgi:hypothetical protein
MKKTSYKKYSREEQRALATWAAECAERVLPFYEKAYPQDDRPRKAIEACRAWIRTGVFRMAEMRGASLAAHAAARDVKENEAACFAAHAAGQAVASAHVAQHAYASAYYALKAVVAIDPAKAEARIKKELSWQSRRIPENLRGEVMKRIIIQKKGDQFLIKIHKGEDF